MLARDFELAALVLDFVEQPHVLDGDYRLVSESGEQANLFVREGPWPGSREPYHPDGNAFPQERHAEYRPVAANLLQIPIGIFLVIEYVREYGQFFLPMQHDRLRPTLWRYRCFCQYISR